MLSVIVLSTGSTSDLDRAIAILVPFVRSLRAELVVARDGKAPFVLQQLADSGNLTYVRGPAGASRAALAQAAMSVARGDILAFREDVVVHDVDWLAPYETAVARSDVASDRPSIDAAELSAEREIPLFTEKLAASSGSSSGIADEVPGRSLFRVGELGVDGGTQTPLH